MSTVFKFYDKFGVHKFTPYDDPNISHYPQVCLRLNKNQSDKQIVSYISVSFMERPLKMLFDTGCAGVQIRADILSDKMKNKIQRDKRMKVRNLGSVWSVGVFVDHILIGEERFKTEFEVFEEGLEVEADGLVGWRFLKRFEAQFKGDFKYLLLNAPVPV